MRYPEQEAAARREAVARQQLAQVLAQQNGAIKAALDLGVLEGTRNLAYTVQGA